MERALEGEMTDHLGYEKHSVEGRDGGNSRNGNPKGRRRLLGFDDKVIALCARGLTTREIQSGLKEIYGADVSPSLISAVTDSSGLVQNTAAYVALAINLEGNKELLGLWVGENEGAKFWLSVLTELNNRGVQDILIAAVDGLKGFPEAIETVFPKTNIQLCIVHMIRKVIYTTNAIESINAQLRKVVKKKGAFPTEDSVRKVMYLAMTRAAERWSRPIKDWAKALNHMAVVFEGRVPL